MSQRGFSAQSAFSAPWGAASFGDSGTGRRMDTSQAGWETTSFASTESPAAASPAGNLTRSTQTRLCCCLRWAWTSRILQTHVHAALVFGTGLQSCLPSWNSASQQPSLSPYRSNELIIQLTNQSTHQPSTSICIHRLPGAGKDGEITTRMLPYLYDLQQIA